MQLLLADNNLYYLETAQKMLQFHNEAFQVDAATSSDELIEKLLKKKYDLILLDYNIDEQKGLETLFRIFKTGLNVPIVMMVEDGQENFALDALENGALN